MTRKLVFQTALAIAASAMLGGISVTSARQLLRQADLLHLLGCLTQEEAIVGFDRSFSGPDSLRIRYIHGIRDTVDKRDTDIFLVVYSGSDREAAYYEISVDAPGNRGALVLRTSGSLKRDGKEWVLDDAEGGVATRVWAQKMVNKVSATKLHVIPLAKMPAPLRSCW